MSGVIAVTCDLRYRGPTPGSALTHGPIGPVFQNIANDLESTVITERSKYKRRVSPHMSVVVVEIAVELFKDSRIVEVYKLLRYLELLPEDSVIFELFNKISSQLNFLAVHECRR
jgi:hypothetical protein